MCKLQMIMPMPAPVATLERRITYFFVSLKGRFLSIVENEIYYLYSSIKNGNCNFLAHYLERETMDTSLLNMLQCL